MLGSGPDVSADPVSVEVEVELVAAAVVGGPAVENGLSLNHGAAYNLASPKSPCDGWAIAQGKLGKFGP